MKNFFQTLWEQSKEFFKKLNRGQWIRLGILVSLLIAIVIGAAVVFGRVEYAPLYTDITQAEAGEIYALLQSQGVPVRTAPMGERVTLSVPKAQADTLRLQLAAQGYPKEGPTHELFKQGAGFGATDSEKQQWAVYDLQANLRTAIISMPQINDAVVFLNIPRDSVFVLDANNKPATASVVVDVKDGGRLTDDQVRAIAQMVANASGLQAEDVSITDINMVAYDLKDPEEQTESTEYALSQMQIQTTVRKDLEDQLLSLLTPIFGGDKVRVAVGVVLNFDKHNIESVKFEPPVPEAGNSGIIISMEELSEMLRTQDQAGGAVGTDPNGIAPEYPANAGDEDNPYQRLERKMNMEVNEIRETISKAQATIDKLSVSVVVDSQADVTEQVRNLVANAIGVAQENISVENMAFAQAGTNAFGDALEAQKQTASRLMLGKVIPLVLVIVAVLVVLAMIFKLIRDAMRLKTLEQTPAQVVGVDLLAGDEAVDAMLYDPMAEHDMQDGDYQDGTDGLELDLGRKPHNLTQLEKLIDKNPQEVAQLLRNWLTESRR